MIYNIRRAPSSAYRDSREEITRGSSRGRHDSSRFPREKPRRSVERSSRSSVPRSSVTSRMYRGSVRVCTPRNWKERERAKKREARKREKKRNAKRKTEGGKEREAKRKPRWRASGACSLLPDDRVHRLLLVAGAPKSRIFDTSRGARARRDSLFH